MTDDRHAKRRIKFKKWAGFAFWSHYPDGGSPALVIRTDSEVIAKATVNAYPFVPPRGCICVKDYGENEGMVEALAAAGVIQGGAILCPKLGHADAKVYKLTPAALAEYLACGRTPEDAARQEAAR